MSYYKNVIALDAVMHSNLSLAPHPDFTFARSLSAATLCVGEFSAACAHFPIVFSIDPIPTVLAILSFRQGHNPFIQKSGVWRQDSYIPATLRAYPFIWIENDDGQLYLGADQTAAILRTGGSNRLFDMGKPTPMLQERMEFCKAIHEDLQRTQEFAAAVRNAGLLEEQRARIDGKTGEPAEIAGFATISEEKFNALPDDVFLDWKKRGWLAAVYAHFISTARWQRLAELANR